MTPEHLRLLPSTRRGPRGASSRCTLACRVSVALVLLTIVVWLCVADWRLYEDVVLACPANMTLPLPVTHFLRNRDGPFPWFYINEASTTNTALRSLRVRIFETHDDINRSYNRTGGPAWLVHPEALGRAASEGWEVLIVTHGDRGGCCPLNRTKCEAIALSPSALVARGGGGPCRRRSIPVFMSNTFTFPNLLLSCAA